jgi:hypothetical protein
MGLIMLLIGQGLLLKQKWAKTLSILASLSVDF